MEVLHSASSVYSMACIQRRSTTVSTKAVEREREKKSPCSACQTKSYSNHLADPETRNFAPLAAPKKKNLCHDVLHHLA